jgi:hypothetical protein
MRSVIFLFAALVVAQPATMNQPKESVVGTWKLVSYWNVSATGEKSAPYGEHPTGFITYTADGRMSAIISADGRKPMSTGDRFAAGAEERAAAFSSFLAYAGTYTLTGEKVVHHVQAAWLQSWVGTDVVRSVTMQRDKIVLRTESREVRGVSQVGELTWQRVP